MKDYYTIKEYENGIKFYLNENNLPHRLSGPAVEWFNGDKSYYIDNICYMNFYKNINKLYIYSKILKLTLEYEVYIKQNIKDLIKEYNSQIKLGYNFYTQKRKLNKIYLNKLPDYLKDLMVL